MDPTFAFSVAMICIAPVLGAIAGSVAAFVKLRRDARAYRVAMAARSGRPAELVRTIR